MTTEPSLALQQAIRERLIASPAVLALVAADHIRDGSTRPEKFPCIIIGDGQTVLQGYYRGWRNITVNLSIHVWALEDGLAAVKAIGHAISNALAPSRPLDVPGYQLTNGIDVESAIYMRDPSELHGHAVLNLSAFMGGSFGE